jgi:CHAT domain-containing protein
MMTAVLLMGQVPILILNACRSALSELTEHQIANRRPLGSLADEILRAGQPAVVAMQYNIDVETAARFVAELYRGLSHQLSLSQAAAAGRRAIFDESRSRHSSSSVRVEDWLVPVVFETAPLSFPFTNCLNPPQHRLFWCLLLSIAPKVLATTTP